jgi:hypothetical protein
MNVASLMCAAHHPQTHLHFKNSITHYEQRVYHGCFEDSARSIVSNIFLREFNVVSAWGRYTYHSVSITRVVQTAHPTQVATSSCLLRGRVLAGEPCLGGSGKIKPAVKPSGSSLHEPMADDLRNPSIYVLSAFRIYVLSADDHAYPEFLVKFSC